MKPPAPALFLALALLCPPARGQDLTVPRSFYGFGDPSALAISADETRAYVGESAAVSVVDLTLLADPLPPAAVLARVPVDASVVALTLDEEDQRLLVAGGSFGLLWLGSAAPYGPATVVEDRGDLVCFEVALTATHVLALFGARDASELRVYERATLAPVGGAALGTGTAFALAVEGTHAFVALGTGGLARVDLTFPAAPLVEPGPVFPPAVFGQPARVRDVAVSAGRLYAAVDALGLATLRTSLPWNGATPYLLTPLSGPAAGGGTAALYAHHVAASGASIAVGANAVAGAEADGGPYTSYGSMSYDLAVGGVSTPPPLAAQDALFVFQQTSGGLALQSRTDLAGAWRELVARPARLYGEHLGLGFVARAWNTPAAPLASHRGEGNAPAEVLLSLVDPDVVLAGQDSAGLVYAGLLSLADPDDIAPIPGTAQLGSFGLWFDAQWLDGDGTHEWFVGSGPDDWRLWRFDAAQPGLAEHWEVTSPDDPEPGSNNGRNYFLSALDGDLLLLTRGGTRYGLVGYSRSALMQAAAVQHPGSFLAVAPLWQVETHLADEASNALTWRCRTITIGARRVAVIAAGTNGSSDPAAATHGQLVLYDVSAGTSAAPALLARVVGPNAAGQLVGLDLRTIGGATYAFVADFGGFLHVFDVSDPLAPQVVGGWAVPPNVFDGVADHPSDVELDRDGLTGALHAYATVWRRGLVRLDVSDPASFLLAPDRVVDTPGLPYGLRIRRVHGAEDLVLADHQAGLRLHGRRRGPPVAPAAGAPAWGGSRER